MSYSVMEALFDGKIIPWERRSTMSAERKALEKKIEIEEQYFTEKMSPEDCERFQELRELINQAVSTEELGIYSHGFTVGALLMQEVMQKKEAIINE